MLLFEEYYCCFKLKIKSLGAFFTGGLKLMIDEILIIRESVPIFYYNKNPKVQLTENWYLLQSGFFVALSQFANETTEQKLKYVALESRVYALDEVSDILLIFGEEEEINDKLLKQLQADIDKSVKYLGYLLEKYNVEGSILNTRQLDGIATDLGYFLKEEEIVQEEQEMEQDLTRNQLQKFIFKSIGYEPGKCNIGPEERSKRLMTGVVGMGLAFLAFPFFLIFKLPPWSSLILTIPVFLAFFGFYQYFFRFCVTNGLTKRYSMK